METKVIEILAEVLGLETSEVAVDANILDDLGADSLAVMEIVMALETEFNFEVPEEDIPTLKTVNDIVAYIESK